MLLPSPQQDGNAGCSAHQIKHRQVFISEPARLEMMDGEIYASIMKASLQIFLNVQHGSLFPNKKCHPLSCSSLIEYV